MEIQALLTKLGYNPGSVDGIFGNQTLQAVRRFQRRHNLTPDGVIGPHTYRVLMPFLLGYTTYTVNPGDTLSALAQRYRITLRELMAANPKINPDNLRVGQTLTVPYNYPVVDINIAYTYAVLQRDLNGLQARYPFLRVGIIGQSVLGRSLYYLRLGTGPNQVFYNAAHHAIEWITVPLLMKFAENFLRAYTLGTNLRDYNIRELWNEASIYIVPMVNPDGVNLVLQGLTRTNPFYSDLIRWNGGSTDFARNWEANIRGVDLNSNYNALWELAKQMAESRYGITGPAPRGYPGPAPESEPETRAMVNFTRNHDFRLILAYHSQGEVIFWNFNNLATAEAYRIGQLLAQVSGYALREGSEMAPYAGYKDWFIQEYNRPAYTVEVGRGRNPLPLSQFPQIYENNEELLLLAATV